MHPLCVCLNHPRTFKTSTNRAWVAELCVIFEINLRKFVLNQCCIVYLVCTVKLRQVCYCLWYIFPTTLELRYVPRRTTLYFTWRFPFRHIPRQHEDMVQNMLLYCIFSKVHVYMFHFYDCKPQICNVIKYMFTRI